MSTNERAEAYRKMRVGIGENAATLVADWVNAVIADEAAKAKPIIRVEKPRVEFVRDNPTPTAGGDSVSSVTMDELSQPVSAGDVPEWRKEFAIRVRKRIREGGCWSAEFVEQVAREESAIIESELSRRIAEVSADRDKWIERAGEHAKTIGEQAKQLAASQAEVSRLSRPVDDLELGTTTFTDAAGNYKTIRVADPKLFQRERNARESAERERDELREFVKLWATCLDGSNKRYSTKRCYPMNDEQLNESLAAFRAEKVKARA